MISPSAYLQSSMRGGKRGGGKPEGAVTRSLVEESKALNRRTRDSPRTLCLMISGINTHKHGGREVGGYGSGGWNAGTGKRCVESLPHVTVRQVLHDAPLNTAFVDLAVRLGGYACRVWLDWTACNYGGARPWFTCPACGRRAGALYWQNRATAPLRLSCRLCARLAYQSQRADAVDRATKRVERLERKLHRMDVRGREMLVKPKGMHWRTFERISARIDVAADAQWHAFGAWARAMMSR
jgi:hypothetical protein